MNHRESNKVLVALDGSGRSSETIKHISKFNPFKQKQIRLFHVFPGVPDCYWDLEKEPASVKAVLQLRAWAHELRKHIETQMEEYRRLLMANGFPPDHVSVCIQDRKKGIARDIAAEAASNYESVVLRRRGHGRLKRWVMGSVATKLISNLKEIPLIIVGQKTVNNRILIGFDGSEDSQNAVDFVTEFISDRDARIHLVHVLRSDRAFGGEGVMGSLSEAFEKEAREHVEILLSNAKTRLTESGFAPVNIDTKFIPGAASRAEALVDEAEATDCSTIVVGRRGLSKVSNFNIGRVSNKVISIGRHHTIWVVT